MNNNINMTHITKRHFAFHFGAVQQTNPERYAYVDLNNNNWADPNEPIIDFGAYDPHPFKNLTKEEYKKAIHFFYYAQFEKGRHTLPLSIIDKMSITQIKGKKPTTTTKFFKEYIQNQIGKKVYDIENAQLVVDYNTDKAYIEFDALIEGNSQDPQELPKPKPKPKH